MEKHLDCNSDSEQRKQMFETIGFGVILCAGEGYVPLCSYLQWESYKTNIGCLRNVKGTFSFKKCSAGFALPFQTQLERTVFTVHSPDRSVGDLRSPLIPFR